MPRPRVTSQMTTARVSRELGMKIGQVVSWVEHGVLPPPTSTDQNGVRYFDQEWLKKAKETVKSRRGD